MAEEAIQPESATPEIVSTEIVARADRTYRWKRYVLVAVIFIYGLMSLRDGFWRYPAENAAAQARGWSNLPHPGFDIPLNQILGVILPPAALAFLAWSLYLSRGELRFDGVTLHVPGHPPVPLSAVRSIDRSRWDRKGIAIVTYELADAQRGSFKLDDFVYERPPTDAIFEHLEVALSGPAAVAESDPASPPGAEDSLERQ